MAAIPLARKRVGVLFTILRFFLLIGIFLTLTATVAWLLVDGRSYEFPSKGIILQRLHLSFSLESMRVKIYAHRLKIQPTTDENPTSFEMPNLQWAEKFIAKLVPWLDIFIHHIDIHDVALKDFRIYQTKEGPFHLQLGTTQGQQTALITQQIDKSYLIQGSALTGVLKLHDHNYGLNLTHPLKAYASLETKNNQLDVELQEDWLKGNLNCTLQSSPSCRFQNVEVLTQDLYGFLEGQVKLNPFDIEASLHNVNSNIFPKKRIDCLLKSNNDPWSFTARTPEGARLDIDLKKHFAELFDPEGKSITTIIYQGSAFKTEKPITLAPFVMLIGEEEQLIEHIIINQIALNPTELNLTLKFSQGRFFKDRLFDDLQGKIFLNSQESSLKITQGQINKQSISKATLTTKNGQLNGKIFGHAFLKAFTPDELQEYASPLPIGRFQVSIDGSVDKPIMTSVWETDLQRLPVPYFIESIKNSVIDGLEFSEIKGLYQQAPFLCAFSAQENNISYMHIQCALKQFHDAYFAQIWDIEIDADKIEDRIIGQIEVKTLDPQLPFEQASFEYNLETRELKLHAQDEEGHFLVLTHQDQLKEVLGHFPFLKIPGDLPSNIGPSSGEEPFINLKVDKLMYEGLQAQLDGLYGQSGYQGNLTFDMPGSKGNLFFHDGTISVEMEKLSLNSLLFSGAKKASQPLPKAIIQTTVKELFLDGESLGELQTQLSTDGNIVQTQELLLQDQAYISLGRLKKKGTTYDTSGKIKIFDLKKFLSKFHQNDLVRYGQGSIHFELSKKRKLKGKFKIELKDTFLKKFHSPFLQRVNLLSAHIFSKAQSTALTEEGLPIDSLSAQLQLDGQQLIIDYCHLKAGGTELLIYGNYHLKDQTLDADLYVYPKLHRVLPTAALLTGHLGAGAVIAAFQYYMQDAFSQLTVQHIHANGSIDALDYQDSPAVNFESLPPRQSAQLERLDGERVQNMTGYLDYPKVKELPPELMEQDKTNLARSAANPDDLKRSEAQAALDLPPLTNPKS